MELELVIFQSHHLSARLADVCHQAQLVAWLLRNVTSLSLNYVLLTVTGRFYTQWIANSLRLVVLNP